MREQVEERLNFFETGAAPSKNADAMRKVLEELALGDDDDEDMDDADAEPALTTLEVSPKKGKSKDRKKKRKSDAMDVDEDEDEAEEPSPKKVKLSKEEKKALKKEKKAKAKAEAAAQEDVDMEGVSGLLSAFIGRSLQVCTKGEKKKNNSYKHLIKGVPGASCACPPWPSWAHLFDAMQGSTR